MVGPGDPSQETWSWCLASIAGRDAAPSLPAKGSLPIGYGDGGGGRIGFSPLRKNEDMEVGFIKLFISTEPAELDDIEQKSPFDQRRGLKELKPSLKKQLWDTRIFTVVLRKPDRKHYEVPMRKRDTSSDTTVMEHPEETKSTLDEVESEWPSKLPFVFLCGLGGLALLALYVSRRN